MTTLPDTYSALASSAPSPDGNQLLRLLKPDTRSRLFPQLESVYIAPGQVLYESGHKVSNVYFPTSCIISLLYVLENGSSAEISVVGKEGVVGIPLFMGGDSMPSRAIARSSGYALRLSGKALMTEFKRHDDLVMLLLLYVQSLFTQTAQTAVCNRHHSVDRQLCRWLLLSLDRVNDNQLTMTQELIANMLGVRREGVTEAAGKLQKLGVINYSRGKITVQDRTKLEKLSCECYDVVRREIDRLFEPFGNEV